MVGPRTLDRALSGIVIGLLPVFGVFIEATLTHLDAEPLEFDRSPPVRSIATSLALSVFVLVGVAAARLHGTIGTRLWVLLAGIGCSIIALVVFARDTFESDPKAFWTMILLLCLALGSDAVWHRRRPTTHSPILAT